MAHIVGTASPEPLYGTADADLMEGLGGNDRLFGNKGDDVLIGGAGADLLNGQAGIDTASYQSALIGLALNLVDTSLSTGDASGDSYVSIERFRLTELDDSFIGAGADDIVDGGAGSDQLHGGDGNDILIGGAGADTLDGGTGEDWASYATSVVALTVNLLVPAVSTGDAAGDVYTGIEGIAGSDFGDTIQLGNDIQMADGGAGDDTIIGTTGSQTIWGGAGSDTIYAMGGSDIVYVSGRDGQADAADTFNRVFGDAGHDQIFGSDGVDELWGGLGNDLLVGGNNDDLLFGDANNDKLLGGDGNDELTGGAGSDLLDGGAGYDIARYLAPVVLDMLNPAANTGDAAGDTLVGIEELRFGSAGLSQYVGGARSYVVVAAGEQARFVAGAGAEYFRRESGLMEVSYATTTKAVTLLAEGDRLLGSVGARLDTILDATSLVLTERSDRVNLSGLTGSIELHAGAGNDRLTLGNAMQAAVYGGLGNDVIDGGAAGGIVSGDLGNDTITLRGVMEAQTQIYGGDGKDTLTLTEGWGIIDGGAGNDTISSGGFVYAYGGDGNDLMSFYDETSMVAATAYGGTGNDLMFAIGYNEADLDGGDGNDTIFLQNVRWMGLKGGAGVDSIEVTNTSGSVTGGTINGGDGNDIILASSMLGGGASGDAGDDRITISGSFLSMGGGDGDDIIDLTLFMSRDHANYVYGGAGDDTITVNVTGWDTYQGGRVYVNIGGDEGDDTIIGFDHSNQFGNSVTEGYSIGSNWGHDTITHFDDRRDRLMFNAFDPAGPTEFSQLVVTGDAENTTITFGDNSLTLVGFDIANFTSEDVWF